MNEPRACRPRRPALTRYAAATRAAASLEGALSVTMIIVMFAAIIGIVSSYQLQSRVERAAWQIARANALALGPAATADDLQARVRAALEAGVGTGLDPERLDVDVTAYVTPADLPTEQLQSGAPYDQPSGVLGGEPDQMVVVRVTYSPTGINVLQRLLGGTVIGSMAVMRNETAAAR